jgi:uncharacterized protein YjiK
MTACPSAAQPLQPLTSRYDLENPLRRFDLPGRLGEVSGLALAGDGALYAHDDERGTVYRIDGKRGLVDRGFRLGDGKVRGDFEGIARVGERLFLVSSVGLLYEFRAAPEHEMTPYRVTDTGLGSTCEIEGLAYLASVDQLLLACKQVRPRRNEVVIHRIPLDPEAPAAPAVRVPFSLFEPFGLDGGVHPSAVDVDPATGHLVILCAREEALAEIDLDGRVVSAIRFRKSRHRQPEGISFGTDGELYVADEAHGGTARLTVYGPGHPGTQR